MGWAGAGAIFDPIAQALIDHGANDELKLLICDKLIEVLQEGAAPARPGREGVR